MPLPAATRRRLPVLAVVGLVFVSPGRSAADEAAFSKKTYTYKTVDKVAIQADVYRADDKQVRPVLVRQLLFERVLPSLAGAEAHS